MNVNIKKQIQKRRQDAGATKERRHRFLASQRALRSNLRHTQHFQGPPDGEACAAKTVPSHCIALIPLNAHGPVWLPCARRRRHGEFFCPAHHDALLGAILGSNNIARLPKSPPVGPPRPKYAHVQKAKRIRAARRLARQRRRRRQKTRRTHTEKNRTQTQALETPTASSA
jgi:hypothetical protein